MENTTLAQAGFGNGQIHLAKTHDGHLLEMGDQVGAEKRDMTVCTMVGCSMPCKFCSARGTFQRNLTADEIVGQVQFMVKSGVLLGRDPKPNRSKRFRVLYTKVGEPMMNVGAVIASIKKLISLYPGVTIVLSTSGIKAGLEKLVSCPDILPHIDLRVSLHSTEEEERQELFDSQVMSIGEIARYAKHWHRVTGRKISLNVILFSGFTYKFDSMITDFGFDTNSISLRLSPWKEVNEVGFNSLLTESTPNGVVAEIENDLTDLGVTYTYATHP
jgi:adenine C2-methylase RlmN of 23S rRNA A2503 and tRNA A37